MIEVFVALGSNLGNSVKIIKEALNCLINSDAIENVRISNFYQTEPISTISQNDFINAVCSFKTSLDPQQLLYFLQKIEYSLGKINKPKEAPRKIDLDILFYGNKTYKFSDLEIPHPKWKERLFVLIPLLDLIEYCPIQKDLTLNEIVSSIKEKQKIELLKFTKTL